MDEYQIATVERRASELRAHLAVLEAQAQLVAVYSAELEEIEEFLAAYHEVKEHGDGQHA